jgi:hypothetical protein
MLFIRKRHRSKGSGSQNTSNFDPDQEYLSTAKITENNYALNNEYSDMKQHLNPVASDVTFSANMNKPLVVA